jgi:putative ABC transport system permease protein
MRPDSMLKSYFITAIRKMRNNKAHSFINIAGLSIGMAVAILIGLWVGDELTFDTYHKNYSSVAQVYRAETYQGVTNIYTGNNSFPMPLAEELRTRYGNLFRHVALATSSGDHLLSYNNRPLSGVGMYVEQEYTSIFTLKMMSGSTSLAAPQTILLKSSLAHALFGNEEATGKVLRLDDKYSVTVGGVFEDLPRNARFSDVDFYCPMGLLISTNGDVKKLMDDWGNSSFQLFVQSVPGMSMEKISSVIKNVYWDKIRNSQPAGSDYKAAIFLHPMKDWHLRSSWNNGVQAGGRIELVWLFGTIGIFVLLLACINFMNLSTARSEKSAKEVGVRKTMGSLRSQLVQQFLSESFLVVCISFLLSIGLVRSSLGWFDQLADKDIRFPVASPGFWLASLVFIVVTAGLAGSYPAFYLSSFSPVKVLKGVFRAGRYAAVPRRALVVVQFTVSMILIAGTLVVYQQVQYAQDRPAGYEKNGLIRIKMNGSELNGKYETLRHELIASGGATAYAQCSSPTTDLDYFDDRFEWPGKDPHKVRSAFALLGVSVDFGSTVGWQFISGRDFSRDFATDSAAVVLNKTAADSMGLKNAGVTIKWNGRPFRVDGIIRDMITGSPYEPVQQSIFILAPNVGPYALVRLNPVMGTKEALARVDDVFKKYNPSSPFSYTFVDEDYGRKFVAEQRIGILTTVFSVLAIFISCLGIFGLASFVAEQKTKEIGIRKVLGASVASLLGLLSREFVLLVALSFLIAMPVAYYFMDGWLHQYAYHNTIAWWILAATGAGAFVVTLLAVGHQSLSAAMANPVKSLKTE